MSFRQMKLRSLEAFVASVEAGSIGRAAYILGIGQPALSALLNRFERELGVRLLIRSQVGVAPTVEGRELYPKAVEMLLDLRALRARVSSASEPRPARARLSIVTSTSLTDLAAGRFIARVGQVLPGVTVELGSATNSRAVQMVADGDVRIGLVADPPENIGLHWHPLAVEPFLLFGLDRDRLAAPRVRPPDPSITRGNLGTVPTIAMADAVSLPLLIQTKQTSLRLRLQRVVDSIGPGLTIAHESDSVDVLRALHAAGVGYSIAPSSAQVLRSGEPTEIRALLVDPIIERTVGIAWPAGVILDGAEMVAVDLLREIVHGEQREGRWIAERIERSHYRLL